MDLKYYKELDGVRGIAALMVMFFHFMPNTNLGPNPMMHFISKLAVFGQTGVTLFFVLSGFLITRILLQSKSGQRYFRNFYIKRSLRIFPLYYLALVIFYFIIPLFIKQPPNSAYQGEYMYWLYLQNIADTFNWSTYGPQHFWSLAVEEHFYLFWPLVIYFTSTKGLVRFIVFVVFMALLCRCLLIYNGYGTFYFTFSVMDGLAIGAFLAWLEVTGKLTAVNFNLLIIVSLILLICTWVFVGGKGYDWIQEVKFPIISVFYMALIGKLISAKGWLNKVFSSQVLRFTGKISYGLYVFHPMCYGLYDHFFGGQNIWVNAICCFAFSYVIAAISFYAFEIHFIKLKRYFEPAKWAKKQEMQFE